jgi:hypothetical protein
MMICRVEVVVGCLCKDEKRNAVEVEDYACIVLYPQNAIPVVNY